MSDAMNDKEAFGYLDESTECPNMTKMSPLMAKGNGQNYPNRSSDNDNPFVQSTHLPKAFTVVSSICWHVFYLLDGLK